MTAIGYEEQIIAFVSASFNDDANIPINWIIDIAKSMKIQIIWLKEIHESRPIEEKIKDHISKCNCFIQILTIDVDTEKSKERGWLGNEMGFAVSSNIKEFAVFIEEGMKTSGLSKIKCDNLIFNRNDLQKNTPKVISYLLDLKERTIENIKSKEQIIQRDINKMVLKNQNSIILGKKIKRIIKTMTKLSQPAYTTSLISLAKNILNNPRFKENFQGKTKGWVTFFDKYGNHINNKIHNLNNRLEQFMKNSNKENDFRDIIADFRNLTSNYYSIYDDFIEMINEGGNIPMEYFKEYDREFKREYDEYIRSLRGINQEIEEIINHFLSDTAILDFGKDLEVDLTN